MTLRMSINHLGHYWTISEKCLVGYFCIKCDGSRVNGNRCNTCYWSRELGSSTDFNKDFSKTCYKASLFDLSSVAAMKIIQLIATFTSVLNLKTK